MTLTTLLTLRLLRCPRGNLVILHVDLFGPEHAAVKPPATTVVPWEVPPGAVEKCIEVDV